MRIEELQVVKAEVEQELADLEKALEKGYISKKNKIVQDLLQVYAHLKYNGKIVDVNLAFSKVGLDGNQDPKLAIVRADARFCYLYKYNHGGAIFSKEPYTNWRTYPKKGIGDIKLQVGAFAFADLDDETRYRKTVVPFIPPRVNLAVSTRILPQHYHIIFEPASWSKSEPRPPRDPILGKMLTANLFGVLATWELTELEAKIVEGRL